MRAILAILPSLIGVVFFFLLGAYGTLLLLP